MLAELFTVSMRLMLMQQQQEQHVSTPLNFTQIGVTWEFKSLYILYNNDTIPKFNLYEYIDGILGTTAGYFSNRPFLIAQLEKSNLSLKQIGGFSVNPLMIIIASNVHDPVLQKADQVTRGRKNICIVILLEKDYMKNKVQTLCEYLFHLQYRRVLIVTSKNNLYSMKAYPTVEAINITDRSVNEYFPPVMQWDLQGYVLKVPVQIDLPNMFWYYDVNTKRIRIDGIGGIMFTVFMQKLNVSMDIYPLYLNTSNYLTITYIEKMLVNGTIEISPHLFPTVEQNQLDYSYPYISPSRCLMVPVGDADDFKLSYVFPDHWTIWSLILLFMVASEVVCQLAIRYSHDFIVAKMYEQHILPGTFVFNAICVLLGFSMPDIKFWNIRSVSWKQHMRSLVCFFLITIGGFCFSQMYSSSLTSGLTISKLAKPKVTVENILNMKQPILVTRMFYNTFLKDKRFGSSAFDKIVFGSPKELINSRLAMNTSYVHIITEDRWNEFNEQQKYLTKKRFWLSDICINISPLQFQMRLDSAFEPYLRYFVMFVREAGLYDVWKSKVFRSAEKHGYMRYFKDPPGYEYLNVREKFSSSFSNLAYILYFCGLILSIAAFALELAYKKIYKAKVRQQTVQKTENILRLKSI